GTTIARRASISARAPVRSSPRRRAWSSIGSSGRGATPSRWCPSWCAEGLSGERTKERRGRPPPPKARRVARPCFLEGFVEGFLEGFLEADVTEPLTEGDAGPRCTLTGTHRRASSLVTPCLYP